MFNFYLENFAIRSLTGSKSTIFPFCYLSLKKCPEEAVKRNVDNIKGCYIFCFEKMGVFIKLYIYIYIHINKDFVCL